MDLLTELTSEDFAATAPICRVIVHEHARRFAKVHLPRSTADLALSWASDLMWPDVSYDALSRTTWIGIDQRVVCLSEDGSILLSIAVDGNYIRTQHFPEAFACICDTSVLLFNRTFSLRSTTTVTDVPESVELVGMDLLVTSVDGKRSTYTA
jgi:hypothetical protein